MKKKLGLLAVLVVMLTMTFAITSCSDDGGVEGTWEAIVKDQGQVTKAVLSILYAEDAVFSELVFDGGVVTVTEIEKDGSRGTSEKGTYTQDGNTVKIIIGGDGATGTIDGSKLSIKNDSDSSSTEPTIYTRA